MVTLPISDSDSTNLYTTFENPWNPTIENTKIYKN